MYMGSIENIEQDFSADPTECLHGEKTRMSRDAQGETFLCDQCNTSIRIDFDNNESSTSD